ncbi:type III-B CRISPR module RAMP protein Cmr4 [Moraxella osloensis]|jgi:CRISPR-associated protein Cmr4|uniref:Type III-B CRISPR module RAMP protein Cmr4 n=1 Tax=Faucicola osloensis TaxID=34062 RepID=A0AAD0ADC1_FAUOS|nr:type III-B CRISPR module RAMP protein Cmr4 [Moraxella osloensis]NOX79482.1 type III-B CRISPR module RAMP protein Cmr4 [Gammaproteobacteria bacterium]ATQ82762.1 type III-B CRISPR module RAMP protein Cmr4 [Moraxella osloensis]ATW85263.1 type III-B CRISPR module RAMP protein Cmr4 [Moraxella osloensis]MDI4510574.1 type III-B CRISPR module RAMP protein Cmr4 [Moraxella osloensis]NPA78261.1 type III-B CRISPR module RAMP protein Cmr4 [Gammaproteobacteria bacterium]
MQSLNQNLIMNMVAQTSIHAGAGQALSVIDLPIQRESHTQFPVIFGSSLKGALRFRASQVLNDNKKLVNVFGADSQSEDTFAGAIMISDAKLLLLPVRSLNGYFKWVTCPALLRRYANDCERAGVNAENLANLNLNINQTEVLVVENKSDKLFLEEFLLSVKVDNTLQAVAKFIAENFKLDETAVNEQLAVVSDDMFTYLAQNSTPVNAHIALDENKTVKKGALWYEETLPSDTVMYSLISCTSSRGKKEDKLEPQQVADVLTGEVLPQDNRYLQVGGNETVGMGWFAVQFSQQAAQ